MTPLYHLLTFTPTAASRIVVGTPVFLCRWLLPPPPNTPTGPRPNLSIVLYKLSGVRTIWHSRDYKQAIFYNTNDVSSVIYDGEKGLKMPPGDTIIHLKRKSLPEENKRFIFYPLGAADPLSRIGVAITGLPHKM